jgi:hypothetical protein
MFKVSTGVNMVHVPYRGMPPAPMPSGTQSLASRPSHDHVELAARGVHAEWVEGWPLVPARATASRRVCEGPWRALPEGYWAAL